MERQPVAIFGLSADDLADDQLDATAERIAAVLTERSNSKPVTDERDR